MKQKIILFLTIALLSFGSLFAYEVDVRSFTPVEICDEEKELEVTSDNSEDTKFIFDTSNYFVSLQTLFSSETLFYKTPVHFYLLKPPRDSPSFS
jgi:hypothetical protein